MADLHFYLAIMRSAASQGSCDLECLVHSRLMKATPAQQVPPSKQDNTVDMNALLPHLAETRVWSLHHCCFLVCNIFKVTDCFGIQSHRLGTADRSHIFQVRLFFILWI
jgi:hypothetical protein